MIILIKLIDPNILNESGYKYVVRKVRKIKKQVRREGYKLVNGKYVRMKCSEKKRRRESAIKAAKHRKNKGVRERQLSMHKRKSLGLERK